MDQAQTNSPLAEPGIGHNQQNPVETLKAYLAATYADLPQRVAEIVARLPTITEIADQNRANELTDFAKKQVIALQDTIAKEMRSKEKRPFVDAGRAVDDFFNPLAQQLQPVVDRLRVVVGAWNRKVEVEEKAKAEAEAKAQLEAAKAAGDKEAVKAAKAEVSAAADVRAAPTRGVHGASSSNRKVWKHRIKDAKKVPREYCSPDDKLIKAAMTAAGDDVGKLKMAGVEFYLDETASFRG